VGASGAVLRSAAGVRGAGAGSDFFGALRGVGGAVAGDELHRQPAEDVIDQALSERDLLVARHAARLEADVLELAHEAVDRHAVLQAHRDERGDAVHQAADRAAFFGHGDEDFAGLAVFVQADGDVALVAADIELVREGVTRVGQAATQRALDDALDDLLNHVGVGGDEIVADDFCSHGKPVGLAHGLCDFIGDFFSCCFDGVCVFFVGGLIEIVIALDVQRLRQLRSVAIERVRFQAELPAELVRGLDLVERGLVREVDGFADRPREERLGGGHHLDVAV